MQSCNQRRNDRELARYFFSETLYWRASWSIPPSDWTLRERSPIGQNMLDLLLDRCLDGLDYSSSRRGIFGALHFFYNCRRSTCGFPDEGKKTLGKRGENSVKPQKDDVGVIFVNIPDHHYSLLKSLSQPRGRVASRCLSILPLADYRILTNV